MLDDIALGNVRTNSGLSVNSGPMSYNEWIHQPEQAHFAYSPGGSEQAYQDYLKGFATDEAAGLNGFDVTGYSQAEWEFQKQQELLAEQRAYNSAEAEKNREFQREMSNTAYQRAVKDLEAAGLNKWLAVTGGNGASASTPSGSSATSSSGDASSPNPRIYIEMIKALASMMNSALKLI